jgi:N-acetylglutamate synthase-like GNAT family acetyltransferase
MMIRMYQAADRNACLEIFHSNCPAGFFDPSEIKGLHHWLDNRDAGTIAHQTSAADFYYVTELDGKVIASAGFYILKDKPVANMAWGMVHNQYHKQGFGKQLLLYRIEQIKKHYPEYSISLDTSQHTYSFFERLGFTVTRITKDAYGPGLDRYDMIN